MKSNKEEIYLNLKTPEELLNFMDENIEYGILDKNGKYYDFDDEEFQLLCTTDWRFKEGIDIVKEGVGHCFDQTEIERYWFERNGYEYKTLFIIFLHNTPYPYGCHSYLIYKNKENDKWNYFEHADENNKGIYQFDTIEECIVYQMNNHINYNESLGYPMNEDIKSTLRVYEFGLPKIGSNDYEYKEYMFTSECKDVTPKRREIIR